MGLSTLTENLILQWQSQLNDVVTEISWSPIGFSWAVSSAGGEIGWICEQPNESSKMLLSPTPRPSADSATDQADKDLRRWTHKTLKKVSQDIEGFRFNTVISSLMEFTNALFDAQRQPVSDNVFQEAIDTLLLMLAPIAPFMAEELWARKGGRNSIHLQTWPNHDIAL